MNFELLKVKAGMIGFNSSFKLYFSQWHSKSVILIVAPSILFGGVSKISPPLFLMSFFNEINFNERYEIENPQINITNNVNGLF